MQKVIEKLDVAEDAAFQCLYDNEEQSSIQNFKLPTRKKDFKGSLISFLYELTLLTYFCLRDKRFREIAKVIFKLIKESRNVTNRVSTAKLLLNVFIELGATFIKIGQFLSSRADLLPKEYIEALSNLQDSLPPLPYSEIEKIISKELRKSTQLMYKFIDHEPIASASIGQVHKAILLSGQEVVLKVQRPNLITLFSKDLAILKCFATFLGRYTSVGKDREWPEIVDEITKTLFEEIDFIQEGRNADKFRRNLKYEERIYIPKIFWQYTTKRLITIEYVPGIKITDVETLIKNNLNPKDLVGVLVNAYFKQFFEDGFYHADPHPGNIVVKNDGTIVFYDFGMVARLSENVRPELANALVSIIANDTDTLLATLKRLELFKKDSDLTPLKKIIDQAAYEYYDGARLHNLNLDEIDDDLKKLFDEKPLHLPSKFTYTLRMTGTLEGVCRTLDPEFSLINVAKPYFQKWIKASLLHGSKWDFLKILFPKHTKRIDKVKLYFEVLKDLPNCVSQKEQVIKEDSKGKASIELQRINALQSEARKSKLKLNLAYSVIFLLCFVTIGSFLIERGNFLVSILGLFLLISSLIGSIVIVWFSIFKVKMLQ